MKILLVFIVMCSLCLPGVANSKDEESWEEFMKKKGQAEETTLIPKGSEGLKLIPKDVIVEELSRPPQPGQSGSQGALVVLTSDSILFDYGSSRLTESSFPQLSEIASALNDSRLAGIPFFYVDGHTCDIGSDSNNCRLSWDRARSVVSHLVSVGRVLPERVRPRGFGEHDPMNPNTSESQRRLNRRVVLRSGLAVVLTKDQSKLCQEEGGRHPGYGGSQEQDYPPGRRPSQSHSSPVLDNEPHEPVFGGLRGSDSKSRNQERRNLQEPSPLKREDIPSGFRRMDLPTQQKGNSTMGTPKGLPSPSPNENR